MSSFKQITPQEAAQLIKGSSPIIVDIRNPQAFEEGHIQHAKQINDDNVELFIKEADKESPLICYCYHGISSQRAAAFFASQGFKEVYSLIGGYDAWRNAHVS